MMNTATQQVYEVCITYRSNRKVSRFRVDSVIEHCAAGIERAIRKAEEFIDGFISIGNCAEEIDQATIVAIDMDDYFDGVDIDDCGGEVVAERSEETGFDWSYDEDL